MWYAPNFFERNTKFIHNIKVCDENIDNVFPQITSNILRKNAICGKMQYILYEVQPHSHFSEWQLSLKERLNLFKMMLPILFRRFTHMKWHIACIHPWHASFNKYYIHPRVLLQSNVFIVLMHGFESNSNGSLPC